MENKEKQTKEEPKDQQQPVQAQPAADDLSEVELDKVAGGRSNLNLSKSNIN